MCYGNDGVIGTSVFVANEVKELTDEELKELLRPLSDVEETQDTFSHKEKWILVKFDYEVAS